MKPRILLLILMLMSFDVHAGNDTLDAAIGAGVGGAVGAAIGNELGGRDGAYVGGALGATVGAHVATDRDGRHATPHREVYRDSYREPDYNALRLYPRYDSRYPHGSGAGYHCPPGQTKKGRC